MDREKKLSQGGQGAVRARLSEHLPAIYRFALTLTRAPDRAQDLVQSTCLRAMEKAHQFDGTGRLDAWCMTICRSIWLNELRAEAVRAAASLETVSDAELQALIPDAETNIFAAEVFTEVMRLPEAQREAVVLVYQQGFRYSEAAQILGVPIGTIMSRLSAARRKLQWLAEAQEDGNRKDVMR